MPSDIQNPVSAQPGNQPPSIEILVDEEVGPRFNKLGLSIAHLREAVLAAASLGDCKECEIGIRVTNDMQIHQVNREFLDHDYPTDVISFPYEFQPPRVEGELIVSLETAATCAPETNLSIAEELLLYVVHGTLHLVGFDDTSDEPRAKMRAAEQAAMTLIGISINKADAHE